MPAPNNKPPRPLWEALAAIDNLDVSETQADRMKTAIFERRKPNRSKATKGESPAAAFKRRAKPAPPADAFAERVAANRARRQAERASADLVRGGRDADASASFAQSRREVAERMDEALAAAERSAKRIDELNGAIALQKARYAETCDAERAAQAKLDAAEARAAEADAAAARAAADVDAADRAAARAAAARARPAPQPPADDPAEAGAADDALALASVERAAPPPPLRHHFFWRLVRLASPAAGVTGLRGHGDASLDEGEAPSSEADHFAALRKVETLSACDGRRRAAAMRRGALVGFWPDGKPPAAPSASPFDAADAAAAEGGDGTADAAAPLGWALLAGGLDGGPGELRWRPDGGGGGGGDDGEAAAIDISRIRAVACDPASRTVRLAVVRSESDDGAIDLDDVAAAYSDLPRGVEAADDAGARRSRGPADGRGGSGVVAIPSLVFGPKPEPGSGYGLGGVDSDDEETGEDADPMATFFLGLVERCERGFGGARAGQTDPCSEADAHVEMWRACGHALSALTPLIGADGALDMVTLEMRAAELVAGTQGGAVREAPVATGPLLKREFGEERGTQYLWWTRAACGGDAGPAAGS